MTVQLWNVLKMMGVPFNGILFSIGLVLGVIMKENRVTGVRMILTPNNGETTIKEITVQEALTIKNAAFTRCGRVSLSVNDNGFMIQDENGMSQFSYIREQGA